MTCRSYDCNYGDGKLVKIVYDLDEAVSLASSRSVAEFKENEEKEKIIKDIEAKKLFAQQEQQRKLLETEKAKQRIAELEKAYSGKCNFEYTKGTEKYNNCLLELEKKDLAEQKKKQELAEASRKKSEAEAKQMAEKLAKMNPDDRRAYNCTEKFGFRKGSDKFKDCIFEIYKAELELEKLELQRELAKANAEAAKVKAEAARASEERQQNLARAQAEAATMQALAARQQAIAANTASSLQMIESGLRMMSPQQPAPRLQTNCYYHARSFSCF
jgi:colicin import membrane protein